MSSSTSISRSLTSEDWATAVVQGADSTSPRWRHLCALAGLLMGFSFKPERSSSSSLQRKLQIGTVKATNLALEEMDAGDGLAANSISIMISYVFDALNDAHKLAINHDLLLPNLYRGPLLSQEGLYWGYFLSAMDAEVIQTSAFIFDWSTKSSTFTKCQRMATGPLISSLGPLSRLLAFSVERTNSVDLLLTMVHDFASFTRSLRTQWRQNKISEIDISEESAFLTQETLKEAIPVLWQVLRSTLFVIVVTLRSLLSRVLYDARLSTAASKLVQF